MAAYKGSCFMLLGQPTQAREHCQEDNRAELVRQLTAAKGFEGAAPRRRLRRPRRPLRRHLELRPGRPGRPQPAGAGRHQDASAAFRLLLEDLGRYRVARKDRGNQGITVYLKLIDQPAGTRARPGQPVRPVGHR
jgi:hypothetical protein